MKIDSGFTLIEVVITMAILGILAAMAIPSYTAYVDKTNTADVATDFAAIGLKMETYFAANGQYPPDLASIGMDRDDPWGNPYQYLNMALQDGNGNKRKDHNLVPINTDYDLYSKGPDGQSATPLTASISKDDIIRANNGAYIGVAGEY